MTLSPRELIACPGPELLQHFVVLMVDADGDIRGFQQRLVERARQLKPSAEALNRADAFFAVRRMFEHMLVIGGRDATIRDLTSTVREALEEAANMRGSHGQPEGNTTSDPPRDPDEDRGAG